MARKEKVTKVIDGDTFKTASLAMWDFRLALAEARVWTSKSDNLKFSFIIGD